MPDRLEFCIVKLKNDLNIFERRQRISTVDDSSLIEDNTEAVYFRYDTDVLEEWEISKRAANEEKYPETHSRKYFFLPQKYMKESNEAGVSELYTNLIFKMKLEKQVTVVQVEPADYKEAFENDPNLVWFAIEAYSIYRYLDPVICMFSEKEQMDQFYPALAERNRDYFMNEDLLHQSILKRSFGDSFRDQHIEALSAAFLHLLKTSSYIPGKAQETQRWAKHRIEHWIDYKFDSYYYEKHSNCPEVFEELQANLFHLHLTRLVYQNYFDSNWNSHNGYAKPAYWNPSNFGWVIFDVIEANLRNKDAVVWEFETLFVDMIFQQPCFRHFLKNKQLRENLGNFILDQYPSIIKDRIESKSIVYTKNMSEEEEEKMKILFRGNYEELKWFWGDSTFTFYMDHVDKLYRYPYKGISVMDTINITTAVLVLYPEEKRERRKENAEDLQKYMAPVLAILSDDCIISEEKETEYFKEMQDILATCFPYYDTDQDSDETDVCSDRDSDEIDVSAELPLDRIYELYCQSKKEGKEVNPSAGLLWLGIAHRQAIGTLGELSEEQQTNCLEMLASALDDLPLQAIETFFSSIQGFKPSARKTSSVLSKNSLLGKRKATDNLDHVTPHDVNNITAEQGKALEQKQASLKEIEERITAYIARRKKEETAVLFLLHSEIGIEVVKVNANMARYEKEHTTSAGIFVFMTLFEYTDAILEGTRDHSKKSFDYYVLTFTKYLINNTKVKDIFTKKKQLRYDVRKHIKSCLKHFEKYEQLNDLLTLDWQTYYNRWVAEVQSHPHVVRIFGVVTDQHNVANGLMMEYCEGGSLDKLIEKSDYMYDEKKTVHWMAQAASALIFFQKTSVVHLDIKPANMLLCKDNHHLKIADMGITLLAEIQDERKLESSISQNDKFAVTARKIGTYGFMAPEMGPDKEKMVCSYASDIFSLGRTLWSIRYKDNPFDEIVNQTVIIPVFLNPIFDATDIPEDQTPQAVENITADMKKTLEQAKMELRNDVKLECSEKIAKWIIRMTRYYPDARPTAVMLHEEFKKQYEEYKRIETEEALKETRATLQIIPSTKITFLHPIEVNQSVGIKLKNTSKTEILQWSASSSNEKIAVVPAEGDIPPSEVVKVTLMYGENSVVEKNMGNFIVNYRIKMDNDEPEKEWPWVSKHLKIVCNL